MEIEREGGSEVITSASTCDEEAQRLVCDGRETSVIQARRRVQVFRGIILGCVLVFAFILRWTRPGRGSPRQDGVVAASDMRDVSMITDSYAVLPSQLDSPQGTTDSHVVVAIQPNSTRPNSTTQANFTNQADVSYSACELQCGAKGKDYRYSNATGEPCCVCIDKVSVLIRKALDLTSAQYEALPLANGTVTASNSGNQMYFPSAQAFDGDYNTLWNGCCTGWPKQWLAYQFPSIQSVCEYSFITDVEECPVSWQFQGSNGGSSWTTLDSRTVQVSEACHPNKKRHYTVSSPGNYTHYRFYFTQGTSTDRGSGIPQDNGYKIVEVGLNSCVRPLSLQSLQDRSTGNEALDLGLGLGIGIGVPVLAGLGVGLGLGIGAAPAAPPAASSSAVLGAGPPPSLPSPPPDGTLGAMPRLWSGNIPDCWEHCHNQTGFCSFCGQSQACCTRHSSHASNPKECWDIPSEHFASFVDFQCVNPVHMVTSAQAGAVAAATARDAGKSAQEQISAAALAASNAEIMTFRETEAAAQKAALAAASEAGLSLDEVPATAGSVAAKDAAPLLHVGGDCYEACGKTSGYCNFCGKGNACCRYGWQTIDGCGGVVSYSLHKHECVWPGKNATEATI